MSNLGVFFALSEREASQLRASDEPSRLEYAARLLVDSDALEHWEFTVDCGEAWEPMHHALTDRQSNPELPSNPLSHVVLGGETLVSNSDLELSLKTPQQARDIAGALATLTEADFRQRFDAIDPADIQFPPDEGDFEWTWECLQDLTQLYAEAAERGSHVLFVRFDSQQNEVPRSDPSVFRNFGIDPAGPIWDHGNVRCLMTGPRILAESALTFVICFIGLATTVFALTALPGELRWLGAVATLFGFAAMVYLGTRAVYRWVEIEGTTLRSKHLFTGRISKRDISQIECIETLTLQIRQTETMVIEAMLGRVLGVDIRFRNSRMPLRIRRVDPAMVNAQQLVETVLYRMKQMGELETQMVHLGGTPIVGKVHWKGEQPSQAAAKRTPAVYWGLLIFSGLCFATPLGCTGQKRLDLKAQSSIPPHEITVAQLIEEGPGNHRHLTITDFHPGKHVVDGKHERWYWVPLFRNDQPANEIKVIFKSENVPSEAALEALLRKGRLTGCCSETPRTNWGMVLGPNLVRANGNLPLVSACDIEDSSNPPSEKGVILASTILYSLALFGSIFVFWSRRF